MIKLHLPPEYDYRENEGLMALSALNQPYRLERGADGALMVEEPTGGATGFRNASITKQLGLWNDRSGLGIVFDSSTGFSLPNGAVLSPDVSWIPLEKWKALDKASIKSYLPLCPDFVVELMSPSDRLFSLQAKMAIYQEQGCRLGWLIDADKREVYIYRKEKPVERIHDFSVSLDGESVLPGFELPLSDLILQ